MAEPVLTAADELIHYFRVREQKRADAVAAVYNGLTDRERLLVREAAVMGFVRGSIYGGGHRAPEVPADSAIVAEVIGACLAMPELYPTLAGRELEEDVPVAETTDLTEVDRGAVAWELTGMLGISIRPSGDGWVLAGDETVAWWNGLDSGKRDAIVASYRQSAGEGQTGG